MIVPQWQIALAVAVGFLVGMLCTWIACRITDKSPTPREEQEQVGADSDPEAQGAPQGAPQGRPSTDD